MNRIQLVCDLLVSYLKHYNVKHIVISSGTRAIPFIKAIETDDYFICHSVVDERNAAFYALGLAQELNTVVGLTCTSGTAASNYLSGITEAYYSHTPIVAITADRSMQVLNQLETQKVNQPAIFEPVTNKSVTLPVIKDGDDFWYAKHLLDEVFLSMNQYSVGPIHINLPIEGSTNDITIDREETKSRLLKPLDYYDGSMHNDWSMVYEQIKSYKRILVVIGQFINIDTETRTAIAQFCHKLNIPILGDNLSNFRCEEMIFASAPIKALDAESFEKLLPDLVISIGNNFQERIKDLLKFHRNKFDHWLVDEGGIIRDWSRSLTALFACPTNHFCSKVIANSDYRTDGSYLNVWKQLSSAATLPAEMPWSNFYLARSFANSIPDGSLLHLAILNSTRLTQFFQLPENIKVSGNVASFGIDGCLPTFIGQSAAAPEKLAFILLGDLSFFYGMNALSIKGISKNVRVLVSNNGGGAEFHIYPHIQKDNTIDNNIAAAHGFMAKGWTESVGFEYLSASDKDGLAEAMAKFVSPDSDRPILLEVFTDLHFDGEYCLEVYKYLESGIKPVLDKL